MPELPATVGDLLSSSRPGSAPYVGVTIQREMSASPSCRSDLFRRHGSVR